MKKTKYPSEHSEQAAVIEWFRLQYPNRHLIAIPSGQWIAGTGKGKWGLIAKYKREGWVAGVSDLFLAHSDGQHHGLWLEMKAKGKNLFSLSSEQRQWLKDMRAEGYVAGWAAGFEDARIMITNYMNGWYKKR